MISQREVTGTNLVDSALKLLVFVEGEGETILMASLKQCKHIYWFGWKIIKYLKYIYYNSNKEQIQILIKLLEGKYMFALKSWLSTKQDRQTKWNKIKECLNPKVATSF